MDIRLKGILDLLDKLNSKTDIVTKEDIDEQYGNLEDYRNLTNELDILLNSFNTVSVDDGDRVEEMLLELHRIITTFEWHFSEISDLNIKILKEYKDIINKN